jgi:hypothetical protein
MEEEQKGKYMKSFIEMCVWKNNSLLAQKNCQLRQSIKLTQARQQTITI